MPSHSAGKKMQKRQPKRKSIPVTVISGFDGEEKRKLLRQIAQNTPLKIGVVYSSDVDGCLFNGGTSDYESIFGVKSTDFVEADMGCIWHWVTQMPGGIFDCIELLIDNCVAGYDRIVVVSNARAEVGIIIREFTDKNRRKVKSSQA
eukprot:CAMPEP_0198204500 /NCGR_PEP_ID=MMETSP1445-20131203/7911_1 /TAXON_ID=36898 /ORGANISM="Pyramimonas sp., Strain CCMP2087" /LENGTH=146 /DNA_ID=CAMNT_0043876399 /DNA_START=108 /DNA_END=544 /DNA_ORIENTATION=+